MTRESRENRDPAHTDPRVEPYLDGLLGDAERAAFEQHMQSDAALRAAVDLQRSINDSLRRNFAPQASAMPIPILDSGRPAGAIRPARYHRWLALAAAVLVLAVSGYWAVMWFANGRGAAGIYRTTVADGFKPRWVCTTDDEFAATVRDRLGQGLLVAASTPGVELIGWRYASDYGNGDSASPLTSGMLVLLAKEQGAKVVLLIDKAAADKPLSVSRSSGLHLFRRVVGDLVVYEITPRDAAAVLDLAYNPDKK